MPKVVIGGVAVGLAGCVLAISLFRGGVIANRAFYSPVAQQHLGLTAADDYRSVVQTLGAPSRQTWQSDAEGREFHVLWYARQRVYIVLMARGSSENYIGALDRNWRPVHTASIAGSIPAYDFLRSLRRF